MPYFNIVAQTSENTVVTEYEPVPKRSDSYQSEAALEQEFIRMLTEQGYEYLTIHSEKDLVANLRTKLEELNDYHFSDDEWSRFFAVRAKEYWGAFHVTKVLNVNYVPRRKPVIKLPGMDSLLTDTHASTYWRKRFLALPESSSVRRSSLVITVQAHFILFIPDKI